MKTKILLRQFQITGVTLALCWLQASTSFSQNSLIWGTYYGSGNQVPNGVALDKAGNVYFAGYTSGATYISSPGSFQTSFGGSGGSGFGDGFLAKFNPAGSRLWATYYGGTGDDYITCVATDALDNVYIAGYTSSANGISTPGAFQTNINSGANNIDGFLVKFDAAGNRLWGTYFGGPATDRFTSIAIDASGNVYIGGTTNSFSGIATPGAFQTVNPGVSGNGFSMWCGMFAKFNTNGNLLWATYYGGPPDWTGVGSTYLNGIAVDKIGNVFICGYSLSLKGIATPGAFVSSFPQNYLSGTAGFLAKFDSGGNRQWGTYIQIGDSRAHGLCTDPSGNIYVVGQSNLNYDSNGWPASSNGVLSNLATPGAFIPNNNFAFALAGSFYYDNYLIKFDTNGSRLWGTYIFSPDTYINSQGELGTNLSSVTTDAAGNVYIGGDVNSKNTGNWIASGGFQNQLNVSAQNYEDAVLMMFDSNGNRVCSTYFGYGNNDDTDGGQNIAVDALGNVYFGGAGTGPIGAGGFQSTPHASGQFNLFLTKFTSCAPALILSASSLAAPACTGGLCNSTGTANPTQGLPPYSYNWSGGQKTQTATKLCAGTYTVTVTDAASATVTATIVIVTPQDLSLTVNSPGPAGSGVGCGDSSSFAIPTAKGGTTGLYSNYTYSWSPVRSPDQSPTNAQDLYNAASGAYTVTVTDAMGCTATSSVTFTNKPPVVANITTTPAGCGGSNGSATVVSASGGWGNATYPYKYNWSNQDTGVVIKNLSAGIYTLTVTDVGLCKGTATAVISNSGSGSVSLSAGPSINCNGGSENITAAASGSSPPYTFSWSSGASSTGSTASNAQSLKAGNYSVTVTDSKGCVSVSSVSISEPPAILLTTSQVSAGCGTANGSASVTASGGTTPFTYSWSTGSTAQTINSISAGTYTVTVNDGKGCTNSTTVIIKSGGNPPVISGIVPTNVSCKGGTTGSATVNATGTGALNYSWNTNSASQTLTGVSAGTYTVSVTDAASGCNTVSTVTITEPVSGIISSVNVTSSACSQNNGSAVINASGGTGVYTYKWSAGGAIGQTISGVAAGAYTVTITDANMCTKTDVASISDVPAPTIDKLNKTDLLCYGDSNGTATITASGGNGSLTYNWSNLATGVTGINNLGAGIYAVTVTDANSCKAVSTVSITEPTAIAANASQAAATCGPANGSASVTANGGTGIYTYIWSTGATGQTITNQSAGTYTVTVADANACTIIKTITINSNTSPPDVSIAAPPAINCKNKSVNLSGASTTQGVSYQWTGGASSPVNPVNIPGIYTLTVTDPANNCTNSATVTVNSDTAKPNISIATPAQLTCSSGTVTLTGNSTTPNVTYQWTNGPGAASSTINATGVYTLTIINPANGCANTATATVTQDGSLPDVNITSGGQLTCTNKTVALTGSSTTSGVVYQWTPGPSTAGYIVNTPGTYTLTVTDPANGCTASSTTSVITTPSLALSLSSLHAKCGKGGSVIATASASSPPYTYSWSNGADTTSNSTTHQINNLAPGIYSLTITDINTCSVTASDTVKNMNSGTITVDPSQQTIFEGNNATITVTGGVSYTWSPGTGLSCTDCPDPTASPTATTTYTLTGVDLSGCPVSAHVTIIVKQPCGDESDVFIANIFSPNNDGKNDVLKIEGNGLSNIYWAIYDRWGNLLFEAHDQTHGWDGTKSGILAETGTYVYYLKATCVKTNTEVRLKGNVSIVK